MPWAFLRWLSPAKMGCSRHTVYAVLDRIGKYAESGTSMQQANQSEEARRFWEKVVRGDAWRLLGLDGRDKL